MTPVFINTAWVNTREKLVLRGGQWRRRLRLPVRVGILERPEGIVLIDAGFSAEAITAPNRSLGLRLYANVLAPHLRPEGNLITALAGLGYAPSDVKTVIVTHFHADHVSALARFPNARFMTQGESLADIRRNGVWSNLRHGVFAELLPEDMDNRLDDIGARPERDGPLGLGPTRDLFGDGSVLSVDLPGHAIGHFGLCFPNEPSPLLYATDAQWMLDAVHGRAPGFPASLVAENGALMADSIARVRRFAEAGGEVMLCHDPAMTPRDLGDVQ